MLGKIGASKAQRSYQHKTWQLIARRHCWPVKREWTTTHTVCPSWCPSRASSKSISRAAVCTTLNTARRTRHQCDLPATGLAHSCRAHSDTTAVNRPHPTDAKTTSLTALRLTSYRLPRRLNAGDDTANRLLSQRRAVGVVRYRCCLGNQLQRQTVVFFLRVVILRQKDISPSFY